MRDCHVLQVIAGYLRLGDELKYKIEKLTNSYHFIDQPLIGLSAAQPLGAMPWWRS